MMFKLSNAPRMTRSYGACSALNYTLGSLRLMSIEVLAKDVTLDEFFEFSNWSMFYLWLGIWSNHNWNKDPFTEADGYCYRNRGE